MDFKKLNDKNYLKEVMLSSNKLDKEITKTRGFILYMMEQEGMYPSLDFLMEKENIFALNFILKNYELEKTQLKSLKKHFLSEAENKVSNAKLSEEEIKEYLVEGYELPKNTILTRDMLNDFIKEIENQFEINEDTADLIIKNSLKNYESQDIMSLKKELLTKNAYVFQEPEFKDYFEDKEFSSFFKELMIKKRGENNLTVSDFQNYRFKKEDKEFLFKLLTNEKNKKSYYSQNYKEIKKLNGGEELISSIEFFENFNSNTLEGIDDQDLIKYQSQFQQKWLKDIEDPINSDKRSKMDIVFRTVCSFEQFKLVVDNEFFSKLMNYNKNFVFLRNYYDEYNDMKDKSVYAHELAVKYILENQINPEKLKNLELPAFTGDLLELSQSIHRIPKDLVNDYLVFLMSFMTKTENMNSWMGYNNNITYKTQHIFDKIAQEKPTMNYLVLIMEKFNRIMNEANKYRYDKKANQEQLLDSIKKITPQLNNKEVSLLANYYDINLDKQDINEDNKIKENNENNFLQMEVKPVSLSEIESSKPILFELLLKLKLEIRKMVLNENYILNKTTIVYLNNFIKEEAIYSFLKEYVEKHKETIKNDKELMEIVGKNSEWRILLSIKEEKEKTEEEIYTQLKKVIYSEEFVTAKSINEKYDYEKLLSKDFINNKIQELILNKTTDLNNEIHPNLKELNYFFDKNREESFALFFEQVKKYDFNTILKYLENEDFKAIIFKALEDKTTNLKFAKYSDKENEIIANLLMLELTTKNVITNNFKLFNLFDVDCLGFINDFVVKNYPDEVFFNYSLRYTNNKSINRDTYVIKPYTTEQLITCYKEVVKNNLFIDLKKNNNELFFAYNFEDRENEFLEFIEKAKEYPKLYLLLANFTVIETFSVKSGGDTNKTFDQKTMEYIHTHFNIDIIKQGMLELFEEVKECQNKHTKDQAHKEKYHHDAMDIISGVVLSMNYSLNSESKSVFEEKPSQEIVKLLFNYSITCLLRFTKVGFYTNLATEMEENLGIYLENSNYSIEDLLYTNDQLDSKDFNPNALSKNNRHNYNTDGYIKGIVNYYIQNNKSEEMIYFSYLVQQYKFFEQEVSYDSKSNIKINNNKANTIINYISQNEELMDIINKTSKKFFLEKALSQKDNVVKKVRKI